MEPLNINVNVNEHDAGNLILRSSINSNSFSYQNRITSPQTAVRSSINKASLREIHVCQP